MTLDELITALEVADPALAVRNGFANPHSYRGYYDELAFEPAANVTVAEMLDDARNARGATFQGYKGGDFTMGGGTDCWLAEYGSCGETIGALLIQLMLADAVLPEPAAADGEPAELRSLPREVRLLVHAVDRMRGDWAEGDSERRAELWRGLHEASDAVWNRPLAVLPAPADRPAVLLWAADAIDATFTGPGSDRYVRYGADLLRRLADEAQQPEGVSGPCDCGEGAVHYTAADCPAARRQAEGAQR